MSSSCSLCSPQAGPGEISRHSWRGATGLLLLWQAFCLRRFLQVCIAPSSVPRAPAASSSSKTCRDSLDVPGLGGMAAVLNIPQHLPAILSTVLVA